jgi:hypothetical protein
LRVPPLSKNQALGQLRSIRNQRVQLANEEGKLVRLLRRYDVPWDRIGLALGVSGSALCHRYGRRREVAS